MCSLATKAATATRSPTATCAKVEAKVDARPKAQWQRLLDDFASAPEDSRLRYRCCGACEGCGTVLGRSRCQTGKERPEVMCSACAGVGLIPAPTEETARCPPGADGTDEAVCVAIVGGGIGGLALALALQQRGVDSAVYERDAAFAVRAQGYGLTLQQGSQAIKALGLSSAVTSAGVSSVRHVSFDALSGDLIGEHGAATRQGEADETQRAIHKRNVHLPRQSLRALLYARLKPGTVRWGQRFRGASAASPDDDEVILRLESEDAAVRRVRAKALIGADGIRSAVRSTLQHRAGDAAAEQDSLESLEVMVILGFTSVGAKSEAAEVFDGTTVAEWVDGHSRLYAMPFEPASPSAPASTMWQLSWPLAEDESRELAKGGAAALREAAMRQCHTWPPAVRELLEATRDEHVTGYPCHHRDPSAQQIPASDQPVHDPLAASSILIGDASHPMAPFKGQGANQAILDAVALARALYDSAIGDDAATANVALMERLGGSDAGVRAQRRRVRSRVPLEQALAAYAQDAAPRAAAKMRASRNSSKLLHSPFALAAQHEAVTRAHAAALEKAKGSY